MTARAEDMVSIPRAELDALRAENRRLRREAGDREALKRIRSDSGEGRTFTREELAEAWGISEGSSPSLLRQDLGRDRRTPAAAPQRRPPGDLPPSRRAGPHASRTISRGGPTARCLPASSSVGWPDDLVQAGSHYLGLEESRVGYAGQR